MAETRPFMALVIVTKDRPADIATISLPSLASQTCQDFGVLVWDASTDDATRLAVDGFAAAHPDMSVAYTRAPRSGTCRQRNDAMESCASDILFFIDDDVELMPMAVAELKRVFDADISERIAGCQCLLADSPASRGIPGRLRNLWYGFWGMWYDGNRQVIRLSGFNRSLCPAAAATVTAMPAGLPPRMDLEWLSGAAMALRRDILVRFGLKFDERLLRFGGYSRGEDLLLSGVLHLRLGYDLACAPSAVAVHHHGAGRHGACADQAAMVVYNHTLIWQELMSARRGSRLALTWARIGLALRCTAPAILGRGTAELMSFRAGLHAAREQPGPP